MRRGALCCDRTASRQPQPSVGPLHLLPRASEAATGHLSRRAPLSSLHESLHEIMLLWVL
jgi:hypothetical protein